MRVWKARSAPRVCRPSRPSGSPTSKPWRSSSCCKFQPFGAGQHALVARPTLRERPCPAQPVGQMADRQRVGFGRVVLHDRLEVRQHQKSRALHAGRHQHEGRVAMPREWLAVGTGDAATLPFADGHGPMIIGQQEIEIRRDHDFVAPGLTGRPAGLFEIVGGRGDQVGHRVDHIATAVVVEVDGVTLERCRHELRRSECAGPGADQLLLLHVAAVDDVERGDELVAEIALAPADAGQASRSNAAPAGRRRSCRNWFRRPRWRRRYDGRRHRLFRPRRRSCDIWRASRGPWRRGHR